jgi:hypothetical protein
MTLPIDPDPATALSAPRFLDAGEAALVVEFGNTVDPAINDRVLAIDAALRADPPAGTREFVGKLWRFDAGHRGHGASHS